MSNLYFLELLPSRFCFKIITALKQFIMNPRLLLSFLVVIFLAFAGFYSLKYFFSGYVKDNIGVAVQKYPGPPEDALIAFLLDDNNSFNDRSHIAIWTLGQLQSEKALPILESLYKNDPEGITCKGHHDSMLCQRELYNAITTIEKGSLFSYRYLQ